MKGYIYKITNTVNKKVYIGQTIISIKRRWKRHIASSKNENTPDYDVKFHRALRKYGEDAFIVEELTFVEAKSKEELIKSLDVLEITYIEECDSYNNGYNSTRGGHAPLLGKTGKENSKSIKILQYTTDGEFVREWDSIADACREYNCQDTCIIHCCKGLRNMKTVCGYVWRYKDDPQNLPVKQVSIGKAKIILQYDLDGNFIREWSSMAEIKRTLNVHIGHIPDVCKGRRNQALGFIWKYKYPDDLIEE